MTATSEATNWISVGELAESFAPQGNVLAPSDDLAGKNVTLHLANGNTIKYAFISGGQLTSTTHAQGAVSESPESYLATSLRDGIYFVDFVRTAAFPPVSVSIVLDLNLGVATQI